MSDQYRTTNYFPATLTRLTNRHDSAGEQMVDFLQRQARGENPDPEEFHRLLLVRSTSGDAMQSQYNIFKKPLKTVLNESK